MQCTVRKWRNYFLIQYLGGIESESLGVRVGRWDRLNSEITSVLSKEMKDPPIRKWVFEVVCVHCALVSIFSSISKFSSVVSSIFSSISSWLVLFLVASLNLASVLPHFSKFSSCVLPHHCLIHM